MIPLPMRTAAPSASAPVSERSMPIFTTLSAARASGPAIAAARAAMPAAYGLATRHHIEVSLFYTIVSKQVPATSRRSTDTT